MRIQRRRRIDVSYYGKEDQKVERMRKESRILFCTLGVCITLQVIFFSNTNPNHTWSLLSSQLANNTEKVTLELMDQPNRLFTENNTDFSSSEIITKEDQPKVLFTFNNNTDFSSSKVHFDIGVPLAYNDERLVDTLCQSLGQAIGDYRKNGDKRTSFRLLVTRYANETTSEEFRLFLASKARLSKQKGDSVMFVPMPGNFTRASAMNGLFQAACGLENCLFARMDVDMQIQSSFLDHSIQYLMTWTNSTNRTMYFPIIWSAFEPKGVLVAEKIFGGDLDPYSKHRGTWRTTGWGMFVLRGPFTKILQMDERYQGWGGEDVHFRKLATKMGMEFVREREPGLVHQWHTKSCTVGKDVSEVQQGPCQTTVGGVEGSKFIRKLKEDMAFFQYLVDLPINTNNNETNHNRSDKEAKRWLAKIKSTFEKTQEQQQ